MPNVVGMKLNDANKVIKELGLEINVEGIDKNESNDKMVINQLPKKGIKVSAGSKVTIYVE